MVKINLFVCKSRCSMERDTCGGGRCPLFEKFVEGTIEFVRLFIIRLCLFASINGSLLSYEESIFLVLVMMRGLKESLL